MHLRGSPHGVPHGAVVHCDASRARQVSTRIHNCGATRRGSSVVGRELGTRYAIVGSECRSGQIFGDRPRADLVALMRASRSSSGFWAVTKPFQP